jgi:hypothetical protein
MVWLSFSIFNQNGEIILLSLDTTCYCIWENRGEEKENTKRDERKTEGSKVTDIK